MALLSVSELKEHVETDLGNDAIQRLLDAAEEEINNAAGPAASVTEYYEAEDHTGGRDIKIWTSRPIGMIGSIAERDDRDDSETTLSSDDYRQQGRRELVRLRDGTNPRTFWAQHVRVTYTPQDDTNTRKMVQVDLVKLMMHFGGIKSETAGDYRVEYFGPDYESQKRQILKRVRRDRVLA